MRHDSFRDGVEIVHAFTHSAYVGACIGFDLSVILGGGVTSTFFLCSYVWSMYFHVVVEPDNLLCDMLEHAFVVSTQAAVASHLDLNSQVNALLYSRASGICLHCATTGFVKRGAERRFTEPSALLRLQMHQLLVEEHHSRGQTAVH